jgi:hypothetical protein
LPEQLGVPVVHVRDIEVDEAADLAIARVLGEVEGEPVAADLHEDGEVRAEAMLPVDTEAEPLDVERLAPA